MNFSATRAHSDKFAESGHLEFSIFRDAREVHAVAPHLRRNRKVYMYASRIAFRGMFTVFQVHARAEPIPRFDRLIVAPNTDRDTLNIAWRSQQRRRYPHQ